MIGTYMERHGVGFARAGNLEDPADQSIGDPMGTHGLSKNQSENDGNVKDVKDVMI